MSLPRLSLLLSGLAFGGLGLYFLIAPGQWIDAFQVAGSGDALRVEIGAMYGGLQLGLGVAFLICAARARWIRSALAVQVATFGGLAAGRLIGMVRFGVSDRLFVILLLVELSGAGLGIFGFRKAWQLMHHNNLR